MFPERYSIKNFKCFKERTTISIRPLTINIGPNNSGKSSFIKSMLLLNHSNNFIKKRIGQYSIDKNKIEIPKEIFSFGIENLGSPENFLNQEDEGLEISLTPIKDSFLDSLANTEASLGLTYYFKKDHFRTLSDIKESKYTFMNIEALPGRGVLLKYTVYLNDIAVIDVKLDEMYYDIGDDGFEMATDAIFSLNFTALNKWNNENIVLDNIATANSFKICFLEESFYDLDGFLETTSEFIEKEQIIHKEFLINLLESTFRGISDFNDSFRKISFVNLDRRHNKRYIDFNNSSLFNNCMNAYFQNNPSNAGRIHNVLGTILPLFDLPKEFKIEPNAEFGFIFKLKVGIDNYRNIADFGSGVNQLLPLFIASAISANSGFIIVEEPESNLHPAFQSKLADLFAFLNNKNSRFIIETHSEYMIRRMQHLVAIKKIDPEDIIINYFWKEGEVHKCKQIEFKENGGLTDSFEKGFYDESLSLQLDLLKLSNLN